MSSRTDPQPDASPRLTGWVLICALCALSVAAWVLVVAGILAIVNV